MRRQNQQKPLKQAAMQQQQTAANRVPQCQRAQPDGIPAPDYVRPDRLYINFNNKQTTTTKRKNTAKPLQPHLNGKNTCTEANGRTIIPKP